MTVKVSVNLAACRSKPMCSPPNRRSESSRLGRFAYIGGYTSSNPRPRRSLLGASQKGMLFCDAPRSERRGQTTNPGIDMRSNPELNNRAKKG